MWPSKSRPAAPRHLGNKIQAHACRLWRQEKVKDSLPRCPGSVL